MLFIKTLYFGILIVLFFSTMIWGIYQSLTFIKKLRAKRNYKGATLFIVEKVIPDRIIEPSTWMLTTILETGAVLLGISIVFLLIIRSKNDSIILHPKDFLTLFAFYFLSFPAISVSGYLFGSRIARAIQNYFFKERNIAFSEQGVLYGGRIIAWAHFRGYAIRSERRYIYLLSKYYPTAIGFSFAPTSNQDFNLIIGEIKNYLPNCGFSSDVQIGIFSNIYFQSALLSVFFLLFGLIGIMMPVAIGIIINSFLLYLHLRISLRIINRIIPTDKSPVAEIE
jgi:hypothetical protein